MKEVVQKLLPIISAAASLEAEPSLKAKFKAYLLCFAKVFCSFLSTF